MQGALGIHVLGRGFGETIVLEFPNGSVGLIDCFSPQLAIPEGKPPSSHNPVLRFLTETLKAQSLAFVGLTHPHEDHARGISHVLHEYAGRIGEIWMFRAFQSHAFGRLLRAMRSSSFQLPVEELLNEKPGSFAMELVKVRQQVIHHCQTNKSEPDCFRDFAGKDSFLLPNEPIRCTFLGPSDPLATLYENHLADSLATALDASGASVDPRWNPGSLNHNLISASLLISYGQTTILLGGDMEFDAWDHIEKQQAASSDQSPRLSCQLFKVSHHGSATGFHPQIAERLKVDGRAPMAVLTPFNRHKSPLPTADGLQQLIPHVSKLIVTNRNEVSRSVERSLDNTVPTPAQDPDGTTGGSIPDSWLPDLCNRPELFQSLAPAVKQTTSASEEQSIAPPIPHAWSNQLLLQPDLIDLLDPKVQDTVDLRKPSSTPETDCRVSVYFDDSGQELRQHRYLGPAAGIWFVATTRLDPSPSQPSAS